MTALRSSRLEAPDPFDPRFLDFPPAPAERFIHVTNMDVRFRVDEAVYHELVRRTWNGFMTRSSKFYARTGGGNKGRKTILLHREVLLLSGFPLPDAEQRWVGDHLDGNELDCRIGNLRWATYGQNRHNRQGSAARDMEGLG